MPRNAKSTENRQNRNTEWRKKIIAKKEISLQKCHDFEETFYHITYGHLRFLSGLWNPEESLLHFSCQLDCPSLCMHKLNTEIQNTFKLNSVLGVQNKISRLVPVLRKIEQGRRPLYARSRFAHTYLDKHLARRKLLGKQDEEKDETHFMSKIHFLFYYVSGCN